MTISLKHSIPADGTFSAQGATAWDDEHVLTQSTGTVLGRSTAGTGATEEISLGTNLTLSGGTLDAAPAGASGEIQFNNGGSFAASPNYTFIDGGGYTRTDLYSDLSSTSYSYILNSANTTGSDIQFFARDTTTLQPLYEANLNIGLDLSQGPYIEMEAFDQVAFAGQLKIAIPTSGSNYNYTLTLPNSPGTAGQFLKTDGTGVLSWDSAITAPAGSDTQVQFNDGGAFAGNSAMTFSKTTGAFSASTVTASATTANTSAISATSYSVTGSSSANMVDLSGTWNTSGSPTGIKLNLTNTASGAGSLLMSLQNGGSTRFSVDPTGSVILGGGTLTANDPVIDASQTWNNAAVTFTGMKLNVTDTASAAASLLMDLQVGGSSRFLFSKGGILSNGGLRVGYTSPINYAVDINNNDTAIQMVSGAYLGWTSSATNANAGSDLRLTRRGAANLRFGAADAAAPVAQTLSVQSVVAGTTNTAGANFTITGSQGTGSAAGGSIIFQVAPAGSSGTAQNALATALTIAASKVITVADTYDLAFSTSTGTKIGTATTQKLSFYNATPVVQPTAVADATDAATVITQLNALLSRMRTLGLIAT